MGYLEYFALNKASHRHFNIKNSPISKEMRLVNIISLIYKGDHYHYIVRTKDEFDFHLHDEYLWNENDYVRLLIPKDSIELSLADEN